jgi:hypothetical protein
MEEIAQTKNAKSKYFNPRRGVSSQRQIRKFRLNSFCPSSPRYSEMVPNRAQPAAKRLAQKKGHRQEANQQKTSPPDESPERGRSRGNISGSSHQSRPVRRISFFCLVTSFSGAARRACPIGPWSAGVCEIMSV